MIYDQTGQWIKSDSLYLDLIKTDSTDAQAYNNFAYSLVERKANLELALEMSLIANKIQPNSAPYLDTLGWIYFHLEQYEKSLEYVQQSYSIDSTNPIIKEIAPEIIESLPKSGPTVLSSTMLIGVGNAPDLNKRAKSVTS